MEKLDIMEVRHHGEVRHQDRPVLPDHLTQDVDQVRDDITDAISCLLG